MFWLNSRFCTLNPSSFMNKKLLHLALLITLSGAVDFAAAQVTTQPATTPAAGRGGRGARGGGPPTRAPNEPGYVKGTELPDGAVPPVDVDGNFILGPTHNPAPEMAVKDGVPRAETFKFTVRSEDSKIYPGIARDQGTFGTPDP